MCVCPRKHSPCSLVVISHSLLSSLFVKTLIPLLSPTGKKEVSNFGSQVTLPLTPLTVDIWGVPTTPATAWTETELVTRIVERKRENIL